MRMTITWSWIRMLTTTCWKAMHLSRTMIVSCCLVWDRDSFYIGIFSVGYRMRMKIWIWECPSFPPHFMLTLTSSFQSSPDSFDEANKARKGKGTEKGQQEKMTKKKNLLEGHWNFNTPSISLRRRSDDYCRLLPWFLISPSRFPDNSSSNVYENLNYL